jgi:hypothetical protein
MANVATQQPDGLLLSEPTMFRNKFINGGMSIDQRGNGAGVTITSSTFMADRWYSINSSGGGTLTGSIVANTSTSNSKAVRLTATAAATSVSGSNYWHGINQAIEGFNVADLVGKDVTISFKFKAAISGTYPVAIRGAGTTNSYVTTIAYTGAGTTQSFTITLNLQSSSFTEVGNGLGLAFTVGFVNTSTYQTSTLNAWQAGNKLSTTSDTNWWGTNGNYIEIGDVQLERGITATPYETKMYSTELELCRRYYYRMNSSDANGTAFRFAAGPVTTSTAGQGVIILPVPMRVIPTISTTGTAANYAVYNGVAITACNAVPTLDAAGCSFESITINATVASGLTAGQGCAIIANSNNTAFLAFSSEL